MATDVTAEEGDSISSIAFEHGFFPKTIWEDAANADLKEKRKDPNILLAGDQVHVPDLRPKKVTIASGKTHTFKRKGVPSLFRLRIMNGDKPLANQSYTLTIDDVDYSGQTDGDGVL